MKSRSERSIRVRNAVIGVVLVAAVAAVLLVWFRGRMGSETEPVSADGSAAPGVLTASEAPVESPDGEPDAATGRWIELTGRAPEWPADLTSPGNCEDVRRDLDRMCSAFDRRVPLLREHGGACVLIEDLAAELEAAPPDLASELRSYDTMLRNVFHVYRVAGRGRMEALRRSLAEQDIAEPGALALYRWAISQVRCSAPGGRPLRRETLYAYAGFLFNTLGGQAYLRRRSPRVEALACFYGLQALDGAIREGHNPQGLDPRPEIPRCRELVASQDLVFSDRYVAELDAISQRWKQRGRTAP